MKLISTCAVAILLMGIIGCDERRARVDAGTDAFVPRVDAYIAPPHDAFVSRDAGRDVGRDAFSGGSMCVARCTTDAQCASSCPPAAGGGTNCCDRGTGSCFPYRFAMCPAAAPDAGMTMPY
jgi:hypothetical protein